jgi:DNA recombination protein RmuC
MARKVHIATPTTLVTMLRTAQYAWQQAALSENARAVFDVGRELYDRLAGMGRHVDRLGKALSSAVTTYNQAVGSLESRVLVSARRFSQLGLVDAGLEAPALVEETARVLSAPELTAEVAASAGPDPGHRPQDTPGPSTSPDPAELTGARYRSEARYRSDAG